SPLQTRSSNDRENEPPRVHHAARRRGCMAARGATGNVTGIFLRQIELTTKRLQVVKDVFPDLRTATVFWDWISADQFRAAERAAPELGLQLFGSELREQPYDYGKALAQAPPDYRAWLFVMTSPFLFRDRARLAEFALRHGAATVFAFREWVDAGGLLSPTAQASTGCTGGLPSMWTGSHAAPGHTTYRSSSLRPSSSSSISRPRRQLFLPRPPRSCCTPTR